MNKGDQTIVWFNQVGKQDTAIAGGKGANLGEMVQFGIPVPDGFIVTAHAYESFIESTGVAEKVLDLLSSLDPADSRKLQETAEQAKQAILSVPIPANVEQAIRRAYRRLGGGLVAVRSSATAEDLPDASFAGQQRTYLNVEGDDDVVAAVQGCWASLFEPRAIFYRFQHGFDHLKVNIAVPIQKMVQSEVSGVIFTLDPLTNDRGKIIIEAVFGLGEAIVGGEITPDFYVVDKSTFKIIDRQHKRQEWQLVMNPQRGDGQEANIKTPLPVFKQHAPKLADGDIVALAKRALNIEKHYQFPQDIEWAREGRNLFILQSRPVTTLDIGEQPRDT
jgi:pyruvate,water dikinase